MSTGKKVSYFYEPDACSHYFAPCHPMVPERVNMTHELVQNYYLFPHMEIMRYKPATVDSLKKIHLPDYIDYLKNVTPSVFTGSKDRPGSAVYDDDCPLFNGVYDFSSSIVGGSLASAARLNLGRADVCINWSGGMHHAKRRCPSGFCYTSDIVACIVELLRYHKRVMYIDIDVHHGDGVEEFFYDTNRVMTVSFHQFGNFFPGTGDIEETGIGQGKDYSINVPLRPGIDDKMYVHIFTTVITKAMERYQPEALVIQMGADSVVGDTLGEFNLSNSGHAKCLKHAMSFNLPTVVLGGGGYSTYNVARTWTLETGIILGKELDNELPPNSYLGLQNEHRFLRIPSIKMTNRNKQKNVKQLLRSVLDTIARTEIAPSVPLMKVPLDWLDVSKEAEEEEPKKDSGKYFPDTGDNPLLQPIAPSGKKACRSTSIISSDGLSKSSPSPGLNCREPTPPEPSDLSDKSLGLTLP